MIQINRLINILKRHDISSSVNMADYWKYLIERDRENWKKTVAQNRNNQKILIATSTGGHDALVSIESILGVALSLRGANIHYLLCDKLLPACLQSTLQAVGENKEFVKSGPQKKLCDSCFQSGKDVYDQLELPVHYFSRYLSVKDTKEIESVCNKLKTEMIPSFTYKGIKIGEHAYAGALRFFAKGTLESEKYGKAILRKYLKASMMTKFVIENLLEQENFDVVVFNHGLYVPQGIIGEVCRRKKIRIVNWNPAYRKKCFIFSHDNTYHHTLMNEDVDYWINLDYDSKIDEQLVSYLKSRWKGTNDWIWFHEKPEFSIEQISDEIGINFSKPTIGMLTNVIWDAQLHYPANAFKSMMEWVIKTIEYFKKRPDLQLVIRIHPAEIRGTLPSRQRVFDEIVKTFPDLPSNVFVIKPESNISTYSVMLNCNSILIYGTKTGVELAAIGMPVIVAGEAWVRNKGITVDVKNPKEYYKILDELPYKSRLNDKIQKRAKKYAYHFFFRRMIPFQFMVETKGWPPYRIKINSLNNLKTGNDKGLDTVCEGIMKNTPFIYKAEKS
jgi:hypothetical protein